MRYSIVYTSRTGNTQQVAAAIRDALPPEGLVWFGAPDDRALAADLIFAGSWTDKGTCDEIMGPFLAKLDGKTVAPFGTAGFGGSRTYFETILGRVEEHLPKTASVREGFMCAGKMGPALRERYAGVLAQNPEDPQAKMMLVNWDRASTHPDADDLAAAARWAEDIWRGR